MNVGTSEILSLCMTLFEFGSFLITLIGLVIAIINLINKK